MDRRGAVDKLPSEHVVPRWPFAVPAPSGCPCPDSFPTSCEFPRIGTLAHLARAPAGPPHRHSAPGQDG